MATTVKNDYSKIVSYALSVTFGSEKAQVLTEISNATPNAVLAIEKLLSIYVEPIINLEPHEKCEQRYIDKKFESYDEWNDRVNFRCKYNSANKDEVPVYRETTSYCSLKCWNEGSSW